MPPESLKLLEDVRSAAVNIRDAQIIAFRNALIHGYDAIDHRRVWDAIENSLPQLLTRIESLLGQAPPPT